MSSPGPPSASGAPRACVDLGTNSALLLVARPDPDEPGGLAVLDEALETPRLGAGLVAGGVLTAAARARALEACGRLVRRARAGGVADADLVVTGTAVLRRARDGAAFAAELAERLGCAVRLLSGEDEARLGRLGVTGGGPGDVVDVGGGSTEWAGADGARVSVPVGALTATETWLGDGEGAADPTRWAALEAGLARAFEAFPAGAVEGAAASAGAPYLIGGTAPNLGCLCAGLAVFDHRAVEGRRVDAERAWAWARELAAEDADARRARPVEAARAAILPAGLACLAAALERVGAEAGVVCGRGLRHGVLLDAG